jgi:hypothetical protein
MQPTMMSLLLWGNIYLIDKVGGEVVGLWPLNAARASATNADGTLDYLIPTDRKTAPLQRR